MSKTLIDGDRIETIVIGGGQTGLTVGSELKSKGREFAILDAGERVGDAWRKRWDSLLLFTPARYLGLPGMQFPAKGEEFVGKDAIADFLEAYAMSQQLPVHLGVEVKSVTHDGGSFLVDLGDRTLHSANVVIAMADYQVPKLPSFAPDLDPDTVQLHSSQYKNPSQLRDGPVLIVGMGNSGADISMEVAKTHETYVAGEQGAYIPFRIEPWYGRNMLVRLVRFIAVRVLNTGTPIGRMARPKLLNQHSPLVRVKPKDIASVASRTGRVTGVEDGKPVVEGGQLLDVSNVIWCTGFEPGFSWVDLPVFDDLGRPIHERGIADQSGLYFCGLFFLHALWSETVTGMPIDARYIVDHIDSRLSKAATVL